MIEKTVVALLLVLALATRTEAQQAKKVYRIGVLTNVLLTAPEVLPLWEVFRKGLSSTAGLPVNEDDNSCQRSAFCMSAGVP